MHLTMLNRIVNRMINQSWKTERKTRPKNLGAKCRQKINTSDKVCYRLFYVQRMFMIILAIAAQCIPSETIDLQFIYQHCRYFSKHFGSCTTKHWELNVEI